MKSIKLNILGINRVSDENTVKDVSCYDVVNLEYRDGYYRPIRLDAIGYPENASGGHISLKNYDYIWLHHISTNRVKWIGLQLYSSGAAESGNLFYLFETDDIDVSKKEYDECCVTAASVVNRQIADDVSPNQVCFVGNLLVVNDVIYNGLDDYNSSLNKSQISLEMMAKRIDKGFATHTTHLSFKSGGENVNSDGVLNNMRGSYERVRAEGDKRGYFQGYTFVRAAVKLYDGSYVNITPPVMVTSGINSSNHSRYNDGVTNAITTYLYKSSDWSVMKMDDGNGTLVDLGQISIDGQGDISYSQTKKGYFAMYFTSTSVIVYPQEVSAIGTLSTYYDEVSQSLKPVQGDSYYTIQSYTISESNGKTYATFEMNAFEWYDYDRVTPPSSIYAKIRANSNLTYSVTVELTEVDKDYTNTKIYNKVPRALPFIYVVGNAVDERVTGKDEEYGRVSTRLYRANSESYSVPQAINRESVEIGASAYFKHDFDRAFEGSSNPLFKYTDDVVFYNENNDPMSSSNAKVTVTYAQNDTEDIALNAVNVQNICCMPDVLFLGSRLKWYISQLGWNVNRGTSDTSVVCIRKSSRIGVKINTNINTTYKDLIQSIDIFMTKPVSIYKNGEDMIKVNDRVPMHPACKEDSKIEDEILSSLNVFYKVKEFALDVIPQDDYVDILDGIDLTGDIFVNREKLTDSSEFVDSMRMRMQYVNNNAVHSVGIENTLKQTVLPLHLYFTEDYHKLLSRLPSIDSGTENVQVYSKFKYNNRYYTRRDNTVVKRSLISINNGTLSSLDKLAEYGLSGVSCISSTSYSTEYAMVYGKYNSTTQEYENNYGVQLKHVSIGDFSIFYLPYFIGYIMTSDCLLNTNLNINEDDNRVFKQGENILKVSQTDNPAYYPDEQTYTIGHGVILGMCANNKEVSQGQYGSYPLYVFTSEGIYGMQVDTTGKRMYSTVTPISKEVCVNPNTICGTDYGIFFATSNGLCVISGTMVKNVSLPMCGATFDYRSDAEGVYDQILGSKLYVELKDEMSYDGNRNSLHDGTNYDGEFVSYLKDRYTYIEYNTRKQALIIYNRRNGDIAGGYKFNRFMYLYSTQAGIYTKMSAHIKCYIKDYPEGLFLMYDYDRKIGDDINVGVVETGGGIHSSTLFKIGEINMSGNDYFRMQHIGDESGRDLAVHYNNHYSDVAFVTRPIKIGGEGFKGNVRVILRGLLYNYWDFASIYANSVADADIEYKADPDDVKPPMKTTRNKFVFSKANEKYGISRVIGMYVYASNDCRRWHRIGAMERVNIVNRDIGCTVHHGGYKFFMIAFVGRLKDNSKIDYIEIQGQEKYNDKIR